MIHKQINYPLYDELAAIVGSRHVSDEDFTLLSYTRDMSLFPPGKPQGIVVCPGCTEEIVHIVRLANQTRTPLIPMGGKASMSGVPPGQPGRGIIVDMRRMDKIIEIDEENMAVTTECGITLGELASRVNEKGWDVPTAALPHYVATVGGNISGMPGGGVAPYAFSTGLNWHYVLGLKVVLPNGSVIETGTGPGSVTSYWGHTWARGMHGPDTTGLFIGDGGIFGIKVEATYRMFHLPKFTKGGAWTFDSVDQAFKAFDSLWQVDPFIYLQPYVAAMVVSPETANLATMGMAPAEWTVILYAVGNSEEEVELKIKTTNEFLEAAGGTAGTPAAVELAANIKKISRDLGFFATLGQMPLFEIVASKRDLLECYKWSYEFIENGYKEKDIDKSKITTMAQIYPLGTGCGMSSIFPMFDPGDRELSKKIFELQWEFLELGASRGFVNEASQGWESRLKARYWSPELYDYILTLKRTLDPNNIMNPGLWGL